MLWVVQNIKICFVKINININYTLKTIANAAIKKINHADKLWARQHESWHHRREATWCRFIWASSVKTRQNTCYKQHRDRINNIADRSFETPTQEPLNPSIDWGPVFVSPLGRPCPALATPFGDGVWVVVVLGGAKNTAVRTSRWRRLNIEWGGQEHWRLELVCFAILKYI